MMSDLELWETTAQTFETLCYLSPIFGPEDGEQVPLPQGGVRVWVPFVAAENQDDPYGGEGAMTLFLHGDPLVNAAVQQMLGIDDVKSESERFDGVGEIVNVLCGKTLGRRVGQYVFNLGHPTAIEGDVPPFPIEPHEAARARIAFVEGVVDVVFYTGRALKAA